MKKIFFLFGLFGLAASGILADDLPPPGGESLFLYGHPAYTTSANSAAGGPLFSAGPYSININPALTAGFQSPVADFGVSVLTDTANAKAGAALHLGASYPTRWGVWTGALRAEFFDFDSLPIGNSVAGHVGFARDVTENLYIGVGLSVGGMFNGAAKDFYAAADAGVWYRIKEVTDLPVFKNIRFGVAFQNLGKSFNHFEAGGVELSYGAGFPGIFQPKAGVAADVLSFEKFKLGLSVDASFPAFSNFVLNTGLQAEIADMFYLSTGWDFNARESSNDYGMHWLYLSCGVKFQVDTSGVKALGKDGVEQTDVKLDGLWQHLHKNIEHIAIGATVNFGARDGMPPAIEIDEIQYK
ncbi:MAG: hypothetical protein LBT01_03715 [Spirochaetaceae bacterium]|nr:hypothetical protein [Spirochaetaceae bacterium]